ncbi:MAG: hypothetical protein ACOX6M_13190 [Armatimonadota bacterium]|jgi:hypothetical protein|nr:hypothetical protein [Acidobacteriota bacterium]
MPRSRPVCPFCHSQPGYGADSGLPAHWESGSKALALTARRGIPR